MKTPSASQVPTCSLVLSFTNVWFCTRSLSHQAGSGLLACCFLSHSSSNEHHKLSEVKPGSEPAAPVSVWCIPNRANCHKNWRKNMLAGDWNHVYWFKKWTNCPGLPGLQGPCLTSQRFVGFLRFFFRCLERQLGCSGEQSRPVALHWSSIVFAFRWNTGACSALAPPAAGRIKTQQNKQKKSSSEPSSLTIPRRWRKKDPSSLIQRNDLNHAASYK